jgi:hypothetical protein
MASNYLKRVECELIHSADRAWQLFPLYWLRKLQKPTTLGVIVAKTNELNFSLHKPVTLGWGG